MIDTAVDDGSRVDPERLRRRRRRTAQLVALWAAAVIAFFLWQTIFYTGIAKALGEWQFNRIGHAFPAMELILLAALFIAPALLVWRWAARPVRRRSRGPAIEALETYGRRFYVIMATIAAIFAVAALIALLPLIAGPSDNTPPLRVAAGLPSALVPPEGHVTLDGTLRLDRIATFDRNLVVTHHTERFAPLQLAGGQSSVIRFFVELGPQDANLPAGAPRTGYLRRNRLPGELAQLYRNAGYQVTEPHYVLYATQGSVRWPFLLTAGQFALAALILLIAALVQRARLRRLRARAGIGVTPA